MDPEPPNERLPSEPTVPNLGVFYQEVLATARGILSKHGSHIGPLMSAEDVAAEATVRLTDGLPLFLMESNYPNRQRYLEAIVRHMAWSLKRSFQPSAIPVDLSEEPAEPTVSERLDAADQMEAIYTWVVVNLSPREAEVFSRRFLYEQTSQQIADALKVPISHVYRLSSRILAKLRQQFVDPDAPESFRTFPCDPGISNRLRKQSGETKSVPGTPGLFKPIPPDSPAAQSPPTEPAPSTNSEAEVILPSNLVEHARLKFRVLVEPGMAKATVEHHLLEIYRALNDYLVERFGTYLPANDFRRLVAEEALRSAKA